MSSIIEYKDEILDQADDAGASLPKSFEYLQQQPRHETEIDPKMKISIADDDADLSFPPPPSRESRRRAWSTNSAPAGNFEHLQQSRPEDEELGQLNIRVVPDDADFAPNIGTAAEHAGGSGGGNSNRGSSGNSRSSGLTRAIARVGLRSHRGSLDNRAGSSNSVSARTLINRGRLGGGAEAFDTDDSRDAESTDDPVLADLRQIALEAGEGDDANLADLAQSAAARQAAGGAGDGGEGEGGVGDDDVPLTRQLISYFRNRPCRKKVLMMVVIGSVIWVVIDFATTGYIKAGLAEFMLWMQAHPGGGFFAFIGMFIVTTLIFIPPSILTLGSGVAFAKAFGLVPGIFLGASASFFGSCVGALIAFFRARYLMRDLIKLFAARYPIVKAFDLAIKHKGFRIYVLLRMCPIIPFNALNYIGGITGVKWTSYTMALVGILPWQITLVFIGATVGSVNNLRDPEQRGYSIVSITVGCVFSVLSLVIMWYYARKELKKEIAAHQAIDEPEEDDAESSVMSTLGSMRRSSIGSISSIQGVIQGESDRSIGEGEDTEWFWIWT